MMQMASSSYHGTTIHVWSPSVLIHEIPVFVATGTGTSYSEDSSPVFRGQKGRVLATTVQYQEYDRNRVQSRLRVLLKVKTDLCPR